MQHTIIVNQLKAMEWELTTSEALVFAFLFSHAASDGGYSYYSHALLIEKLPLVSDKSDTFSKIILSLERKELLLRKKHRDQTVIAYSLTDKSKCWQRAGGRDE